MSTEVDVAGPAEALVRRCREFEIDHPPNGYPPITMREVSALCDALERYREALEWVRKWDEWNPENDLPRGWPMREDEPDTPLSAADIVYSALEA